MRRPSLAFLLALCLLTLPLASCKRSSQTPDAVAGDGAGAPADPLATFSVTADNEDLVFQYFGPGGKITAATAISDVPEAHRTNVIILSRAFQKGDLPADQIIVANLEAPDEDGAYPYRLVSRYEGEFAPASAPTTQPAAAPSQGKVLVFTTPWCPHCRTAKSWLASKGVPFAEHDVDKDPNARALLLKLGQEQGIPQHMLSSVPILYVQGKLMLGFNQSEVARLLGL